MTSSPKKAKIDEASKKISDAMMHSQRMLASKFQKILDSTAGLPDTPPLRRYARSLSGGQPSLDGMLLLYNTKFVMDSNAVASVYTANMCNTVDSSFQLAQLFMEELEDASICIDENAQEGDCCTGAFPAYGHTELFA